MGRERRRARGRLKGCVHHHPHVLNAPCFICRGLRKIGHDHQMEESHGALLVLRVLAPIRANAILRGDVPACRLNPHVLITGVAAKGIGTLVPVKRPCPQDLPSATNACLVHRPKSVRRYARIAIIVPIPKFVPDLHLLVVPRVDLPKVHGYRERRVHARTDRQIKLAPETSALVG